MILEPKMPCPFCTHKNATIISRSQHSIARLDAFPLTDGHVLIISKRHVSNFFDLSITEQMDMLKLLNKVKQITDSSLNTSDYNVGINCGPAAGQTVDHVHMHLIPRRKGDIEDPRGGVRWIIPERAAYWDKTDSNHE